MKIRIESKDNGVMRALTFLNSVSKITKTNLHFMMRAIKNRRPVST